MPSATPKADDSTGSNPKPMTFPRATIAALAPRPYLLAHLNPPDPSSPRARPDGRTTGAFRAPSCNTGALSHCAGSAVLRVGDTAVVCGIQAEILLASSVADPPRSSDSASDHLAQLNLLVPNVDLATGCSPAHMPGGPPSPEAQALTQRVYSMLHTSHLLDADDLKILYTRPPQVDAEDESMDQEPQTIAYWTLYISVHVLALSGSSSLIDAVWTSVLAALRDVKLPHATWNPDLEAVVCSDRPEEARSLKLNGTPLCCTWGVFVAKRSELSQAGNVAPAECKTLQDRRRAWLLADPDAFEDPLCQETVTLVVDGTWERAKVLKVEKSGGGVLGIAEMKTLVKAAETRWRDLSAILP